MLAGWLTLVVQQKVWAKTYERQRRRQLSQSESSSSGSGST